MSYRTGGVKNLKVKLAKPSDNIGSLLLLQSMSATLLGLPDPRTYLKGQGLGLLYVPNNTHRLDVLQNRILVQDRIGIEICLSLSFFFFLFSFFACPLSSLSPALLSCPLRVTGQPWLAWNPLVEQTALEFIAFLQLCLLGAVWLQMCATLPGLE